MSETWLKENNLLLQYVTIPGYEIQQTGRNRHSKLLVGTTYRSDTILPYLPG